LEGKMLNYYCENVLKLKGDSKEIQRFQEQGKHDYDEGLETSFAFQKFLPEPEELGNYFQRVVQTSSVLKARYGFDDPDAWCLENWGVDCDIFADDPIDNRYDFETELDPPIKGIVNISKQFPGLKFFLSYQKFAYKDENSVDFGNLVIRNGSIESEEYKEKVESTLSLL
jgi:hypothetical protein